MPTSDNVTNVDTNDWLTCNNCKGKYASLGVHLILVRVCRKYYEQYPDEYPFKSTITVDDDK